MSYGFNYNRNKTEPDGETGNILCLLRTKLRRPRQGIGGAVGAASLTALMVTQDPVPLCPAGEALSPVTPSTSLQRGPLGGAPPTLEQSSGQRGRGAATSLFN